jgi:hypothetical protein
MKPVIYKYIALAVVVTIIWTLIEHFLGYNTTDHETGQYTRILTTFFYWACIIAAIYETRKKQGGVLSFKNGINTGAMVALGYSAVIAVWFAFYAEVINTAYKPTLMAFEKNKLVAKGASPEKIAEKMKEVDMTSGGSVVSYILFVFMAVFGIGIALIASLILQKRPRNNPV